jgi:diguanylate cyclase (GGDEF)-like protein
VLYYWASLLAGGAFVIAVLVPMDPASWAQHLTEVVLFAAWSAWMLLLGYRLTTRIVRQSRDRSQLERSEETLRRAQAVAKVGSWEFFAETGHVVWSDEEYRLHGIPVGTPIDYRRFMEQVHPDDQEAVDASWRHTTAGEGKKFEIEYRVLDHGQVRWLHALAEMHFDAGGKVSRMIGTTQDVTEVRHKDELIRFQAHHDELTALPNRALLSDRLEHALDVARRNGTSVGVLFLDLDNFKYVNDSMGHAVGDCLLQEAAARLSAIVRRSDTVARIGGDEFVIVAGSVLQPSEVATIAEKVVSAIANPFEVTGRVIHSSASIGIALAPEGGYDAAALIQSADTAMYRAKAAGKNGFRFYDESMHAEVMHRIEIEARLRAAVRERQFLLVYQPKFDTESGEVVGIEALLRWRRGDGALSSPAEFLAIAEESRLIFDIGEWVLDEVCRQARRWLDGGIAIRIALNLSARQFEDERLFSRVQQALEASALPGACLEIELTESVAMRNPRRASEVLAQLRELGVTASIDDFGTGYSSLSYLKHLPISAVKIDRSFVLGIPQDRNDMQIIRTIVALGKSFGIATVAEGVETREQYASLRDLECTQVQGYLLAEPMQADEFARWLSGYQRRATAPLLKAAG